MIGPALRRIDVLSEAGQIEPEREHRANTITRRVLATLYRYMTSGTEPTRERVLLAGIEGDEHTLGLQMVHDQLAAAGFQTVFDTDVSRRAAAGDGREQVPRPVIVLGATARARTLESIERRCASCAAVTRASRSCSAAPPSAAACPREREGMHVLERIDESVAGGRGSARAGRLDGVRIDFPA